MAGPAAGIVVLVTSYEVVSLGVLLTNRAPGREHRGCVGPER